MLYVTNPNTTKSGSGAGFGDKRAIIISQWLFYSKINSSSLAKSFSLPAKILFSENSPRLSRNSKRKWKSLIMSFPEILRKFFGKWKSKMRRKKKSRKKRRNK